MPLPCASKKLGANLSEAEIELLVAQAMGFLHMDNIVEASELLVDSAMTAITMAPPLPSSTPPTTELAEMTDSNAAVAGAVTATCVVTVVGGTGVLVGASVLMATVLSPVKVVSKPTPSPSPYQVIIPKVQCPDAGAAMFAGYNVSKTSEDRQLLM
eukprot:scaffold53669_cov61-Attheya_sp.AAC.1